MDAVLLVILIFMLVGAWLIWFYARKWDLGYTTSSVLGFAFFIVIILILIGHVPL